MISKAVSVRELIEDFHLTNVVPNADDSRNITVTDINRPGLELTGYYQHTELKRIVVLGNKEIEYINTFTDKAHFKEPFAMISSSEVPCIIITNNNVCPPDLYVAAKKNKTAILLTNLKSSQFITSLTLFLSEAMAPSLSLHGTLLEVSGVGLLLLGASGIGKSEIALDLVRRGHRLVADDSVEITYVSNALYGKAPEVLKRVIEVRGLGVIDVTNIFGISSYKERQQIDYVIQLKHLDENKSTLERIGLEETYKDILGLKIPHSIIPVALGRTVADIIEIAVKNFLLKKNGIDSGKMFSERVDSLIKKKGSRK